MFLLNKKVNYNRMKKSNKTRKMKQKDKINIKGYSSFRKTYVFQTKIMVVNVCSSVDDQNGDDGVINEYYC